VQIYEFPLKHENRKFIQMKKKQEAV